MAGLNIANAASAPPASSTTSSTSSTNANNKRPAEDKPSRQIKRRASKACKCCRARKVRCNVVEHGAPCTNCRLDEVECVVTESKRKRKSLARLTETPVYPGAFPHPPAPIPFRDGERLQPQGILDGVASLKRQASIVEHIPHSLYAIHQGDGSEDSSSRRASVPSFNASNYPVFGHTQDLCDSRSNASQSAPSHGALPAYIKPVPQRIPHDDVSFLERKLVFAMPPVALRNEILRRYVEFVHPLMPILELQETLEIVERGDGSNGRLSLLLFHAMMFAGTAFADSAQLREAGYSSRKDARKDFFQRARLLYDFDYELDRLSVIQSLLLMTYWYGTPDDQKDTWHWMGLAVSWAQTIGLQRDPTKSCMDVQKQRLWKRIWWACVMRDRSIALGMRRPTRIKSEDCDVPMLELSDFEIRRLPDELSCVSSQCRLARDVAMQRTLALMCIDHAKLCICIGDVLSTVYSVPDKNTGMMASQGNPSTTSLLLPKGPEAEMEAVKACHQQLQDWLRTLAPGSQLPQENVMDETGDDEAPIATNRALMHMLYFTILSALHRPQLSSLKEQNHLHHDSGIESDDGSSPTEEESLLEISKKSVHFAASEITRISGSLLEQDLVRFMPTAGVTVLSPAIINHLLDMKSDDDEARMTGLRGFCLCIQVMNRLRDCYPSADYTIAFLEAAVRKTDIKIPAADGTLVKATGTDDLLAAGIREGLIPARLHNKSQGNSLVNTPRHPKPDPMDSAPVFQDTRASSLLDSPLPKTVGTFGEHDTLLAASDPGPMFDTSPAGHAGGVSVAGAFNVVDELAAGDIDSLLAGNDDFDGMSWTGGEDPWAKASDFIDAGDMQGENAAFALDVDWILNPGTMDDGEEEDMLDVST